MTNLLSKLSNKFFDAFFENKENKLFKTYKHPSNSDTDNTKYLHSIKLISNLKQIQVIREGFEKIPYDDHLFNDSSFTAQLKVDYEEGIKTIPEPSSKKYETKLSEETCTCKDWVQRRNIYQFNDPRRLCKHLIKKLSMHNLQMPYSHFRETLNYCQEQGKGSPTKMYAIVEIPDTEIIVFLKSSWSDAYDKDGNRYSFALHSYKDEEFLWWDKIPKDYEKMEIFFQQELFQYPIRIQLDEILQIKKYIIYNSKLHFDNLTFMESEFGEAKHTESVRIHDVKIKDKVLGEIYGLAEISNRYIRISGFPGYKNCVFQRNKAQIDSEILKRNKKSDKKRERDRSLREDHEPLRNLLEKYKTPINFQSFYRLLKQRSMIYKEEKKYHIIKEGLEYGMESYGKNYWNKYRFEELLRILESDLEDEQKIKNEQKIKPQKKKKDFISKQKFDINGDVLICPRCESYKVHKKDIRTLTYRKVQRYQCKDCNRLFTITI